MIREFFCPCVARTYAPLSRFPPPDASPFGSSLLFMSVLCSIFFNSWWSRFPATLDPDIFLFSCIFDTSWQRHLLATPHHSTPPFWLAHLSLRVSGFSSKCSRVLLCPTFLACSGCSAHCPSTFRTTPCRALPSVFCHIFSTCGWSHYPATLDSHIFLEFDLVAASSASPATICACCRTPLLTMLRCFHYFVHKSPLLLAWVSVLHSLSIFHQTMKSRNILQCFCFSFIALKKSIFLLASVGVFPQMRIAIPQRLLLLLDCAGFDLRHHSSIHHRSIFCQLVCLLIALSDALFRRATLVASLSWSDAHRHAHQYAFLMNSVQLFPNLRPMHFITMNNQMIPLLSTWTMVAFLKAQEGRQLSSLDCTLHLQLSIQRSEHPMHGPHLSSSSSCTTHHPQALHLHRTPHKAPSVATWSPTPKAHQLLGLCDALRRTVRWLFLQLPSLREGDLIPLLHFQSSCDVLALSSHFPSPSGIWFLTSLCDGQWYSLVFSVPSSLLQHRHFPFRPTNQCRTIFCTHPPSTTRFVVACRRLSVQASLVFLHSKVLDWLQPHSLCELLTFVHCRPLLCPPLPAPQKLTCSSSVTFCINHGSRTKPFLQVL